MGTFSTWLKSVYSEPDGSGSSTRIHVSAIIAFILGIGISFATATHYKVFTIDQFNSFLSSASLFIVSTCGPLYGMNKVSDWAKNRDNNKDKDKDGQPGA